MSIAVVITVHDGLVIAADSAASLTMIGPSTGIAKVYNNANKIFNLFKGKPIGCVVYGTGSIGNASMATLIKDLRSLLMNEGTAEELGFDAESFTMEDIAKILTKFLGEECEKIAGQPALLTTDIGILVGGYSTNSSFGELWSIGIQKGQTKEPVRLRAENDAGLNWGGASEIVQRIVIGYSPNLFPVLSDLNTPKKTAEELFSELNPLLSAKLQAPLVFAPMPIQDAIELAEFLVHASIMYSRFIPGMQIVGGPIEVAAITKHEGFKWISRKYYYDRNLNPEPTHELIDR
jgi:hypothetical protein